MSRAPHRLRDFSDPPVIETVISVQFPPITGFTLAHVGLYWQLIRKEFIGVECREPLGHIKEGSSGQKGKTRVELKMLPEPPVRFWFRDEKGNQLIQLQKDRFVHNWQKVSGEEIYPRYESVLSKFESEWVRFGEFLKAEKLPAPEVDQCEVTYVNHIEYEKGWKGFGELSKVIACWSGELSEGFLPPPEKVNLNVTYLLPEKQGRLYISMQPVIRARDAKEVLQLNLIARGAPATSENEDVFHWLDLGRQWVVEGFTDFTTKGMHSVWGRIK